MYVYVRNFIIPSDFLISFRGVAEPAITHSQSLALPPRTDVDVQYHYELKPFETERALIRQAEARLKRMLETAPR